MCAGLPVIEHIPYGLSELLEAHEVEIMEEIHVRVIHVEEITRLLHERIEKQQVNRGSD